MGILDTITSIFTGDPAKEAAEKNRQLLLQNQSQGFADLGRARAQQEDAFGRIGDRYRDFGQVFSGRYSPMVDLYTGALGGRGDEGRQEAREAFQASPGYEWSRDQALQGVMRNMAGRKMLASGNTMMALQDRGDQLANQQWERWQDRLGAFVQPEFQAASAAAAGESDADRGLAAIYGDDAARRLNLRGQTTQGLMGANNQVANATMGGSANLWGLGLAGSKIGADALGRNSRPPSAWDNWFKAKFG